MRKHLIIQKVNDRYSAEVSCEYYKIHWKSGEPLTAKDLVDKLLEIGCHQQDIADAFSEISPNWIEEVGKERESVILTYK
jgi:hypothetical protein